MCVCDLKCCVCVCVGGGDGVQLKVSFAAYSLHLLPVLHIHPGGPDWQEEEGVEVLLAAKCEKVLIYSVFGFKLVNIAIKNYFVKESL